MDTATAGSSSPPITPRADDSPEPSLPGEKVYVAVGREVAESRATLLWAMHKFPRGAGAVSFVLLHVYSPPKFLPFRTFLLLFLHFFFSIHFKWKGLPVLHLGARIAAAQVGEKELAAYKKMELQRANDSLDQYLHLLDLISEHHVTVLVMGTAVDKNYTKEAVQPSHEEMQECRQSPGVTYYSVEKSTSLSEMWCVANTWLCKSTREPHIERTNSDPFHLTGKENVEESCESYDNFQYVLRELESARKEAYEEKCRREKAERELFEALQKAHASENSYFREMKQKNELEEKLAAIMEEIESLTVEILSRVRHPNLVTLIGACKDAQALVYEYMPNGSLDDRLACKDNSKPLSWQLRTRIASNICSALIFLHSNKPHSIVHSDLKASNILLDGNNVAKLSGFSVSQILTDQFKATTTLYRYTHPKCSFVYIDPEYLISGDLTPQSDVYSFGIVLLRLLTGRSGFGLLQEVQQAVEKGCMQTILDSSAGEWPAMYAEHLAELGLRCCRIRRKNRPDLQTEIWTVLEPMFKSASVMLCSLSFKSVSEDLGDVPSYFICPILQDVMRDPLIAADGFTYEADAIREWLDSGHRTSPMTNLELPHRDLLPNHALRSAIQEWLQTNGD
ncbi:hypothetical protein HU200_011656 [Digitaria exilis]|uniref:RING-type E3 ubiquitin transferase n=1 Tax=Digitaria exilis TaxID=1010633 RepID=A0A835FFG9_9POAL|nr:hypothetical protein HU200_011656 [Digitaria exilis]